MAWHPANDLGKLGMDVGLLDAVVHNRAISGEEAAGFYQMLAAVGHASLNDLLAATRGRQWTVIPPTLDPLQVENTLKKLKEKNPLLEFYFIDEPEQYVGELMAFDGQVYRCVRVDIADRELAERLKFDHYFNLVLFIDLEYKLNLADADEGKVDAEGRRIPTEVKTYPVCACVRELPFGFPTGEKLKERVRVPGYFFKQWPYRSAAAAALHPNRPERSPLIIGPGVQWLSKPQAADATWQIVLGGAFVALIAALCFVLWRVQRRDRKFREEVLTRDQGAPALDSFDDSTA